MTADATAGVGGGLPRGQQLPPASKALEPAEVEQGGREEAVRGDAQDGGLGGRESG